MASYKLTLNPGEQYEYSNLAVGLLTFALAHRAGMSYADLVRTRIFHPLHMDSSTVELPPDRRKRLAQGFDAHLQPVKNWDLNALAGAGAIRSTANDMLKFMAAGVGLTDTPLNAAMKQMRSLRAETGVLHLQIAMAWNIRTELPSDLFLARRRDGRLPILRRHQLDVEPEFEVFSSAKDEFFLKVV